MRRLVSGWTESARAVGSALLAVWRAELEVLRQELARSGRALRGGAVLLAVAAGVAFWTIGLGIWVGVELLTAYLPRWGAAAAVFGAGLLLTALLVLLGLRRFKQIETPARMLRRRGEEHAEWWRTHVMPEAHGMGDAGERGVDPGRDAALHGDTDASGDDRAD